jgi:hypothetical protein
MLGIVPEDQLVTVSSTAVDRLPDAGRLRAALVERAADIRRVLTRREPETRRVLQAVISGRLAFAPFRTIRFREKTARRYVSHQQWWPQRDSAVRRFAVLPFEGLASSRLTDV